MASLAPKACCVTGSKHEGTPSGSIIDVADFEAYVSGDKGAGKTVLIITDVFGYKFINNQLLADSYAEQGFYAVIPDLFRGDALSLNEMDKLQEWAGRHGVEQTEPIVLKTVEWIQKDVKPAFFAVAGYCYGAKYAIRILGEGSAVSAAMIAHPSFVAIDEVAQITKPILICGAQTDPVYTPELRAQTEEKLKEIKATYFLTEASGVYHGFAVRGDPTDKWQLIAKDKAFSDAVWWFSVFQ